MVFGAAHPCLIGNARRKQARESLSSIAPGTAAFGGSWSHSQIVQEDLDAEKDRVVSLDPTEVRRDSDRQCSFSRSRFLPASGCLLPNLRT